MSDRYVVTVAVASPSNPGRCVGAWMVRLGERLRLQIADDLGVCSTHRAALLTMAGGLRAERAQKLPVLVRCNQLAAVKAIKGGLVELRPELHPRALGFDDGVNAVLDAVRGAGVPVEFEFVANATGDADLLAARDAAGEVSRQRRTA